MIFKNKRRLRSSSWLARIHLTTGKNNLTKEEKENYIRKRVLTSREAKNIEENITTNQVLKNVDFLEKLPIVQQEKITVSVGHVEK